MNEQVQIWDWFSYVFQVKIYVNNSGFINVI